MKAAIRLIKTILGLLQAYEGWLKPGKLYLGYENTSQQHINKAAGICHVKFWVSGGTEMYNVCIWWSKVVLSIIQNQQNLLLSLVLKENSRISVQIILRCSVMRSIHDMHAYMNGTTAANNVTCCSKAMPLYDSVLICVAIGDLGYL